MALERLSLSVEMEGHRPCAKKQQNLVPGDRLNPFAFIGSLYRWPREPTGLWDSALEPIQHPISSRGGIHSPLIVRLNNFKSEGGKIKRSLFRSSFYAGTMAQHDAQFF